MLSVAFQTSALDLNWGGTCAQNASSFRQSSVALIQT